MCIQGIDPKGDEGQQWLTDRLWRIASDKLGARYHNGQLIRSAEVVRKMHMNTLTGKFWSRKICEIL